MSRIAMKHAPGGRARHSSTSVVEPVDMRMPGPVFLQQELERDRRSERWLVLKALIAIGIVAILIVVRETFFV